MFEFTDRKTAIALVKYERDRNKVVYPEYIAANGVTLDTVSEHVKALQALAFPDFNAKTADDEAKYVRKTFGNRVRNGLNFHLGKRPEAKQETPGTDAHPIDPETGEDIPSAEEAPHESNRPVTVQDIPTGDLGKHALSVISELIKRANAGDSEAMRAVNLIQEATYAPDVRTLDADGSRVAA